MGSSLTVKAVLLSSGVVSMAMICKLTLPIIFDFMTSEIPQLWSLLTSYLQPPYLYILINCIILSIVASSKLHPPPPEKFSGKAPAIVEEEREYVAAKEDDAVAVPPVEVVFGCVDDETTPLKVENVEEERESDEFVISRSTWTPAKREEEVAVEEECCPPVVIEKPPVSSRFAHRKTVKASPEGKALLKVSKPKRKETLGSTWRTITDGRPMPLTRHLRKSDSFAVGASPDASPVHVMRKSDTFNAGSTGNSSPASGCGSSGKLRKEASLSQDELNRRVEAFIKKFNEEMRLQRQESLNQYREMVGRGAH